MLEFNIINRMKTVSFTRQIKLALLSWLLIIAFDFLLHGGLLAGFYNWSSSFLLSPSEAFRLIPLGYLSFLLLIILLLWLMVRLKIHKWRDGFVFGLKLGLLAWGAFMLGLISISTAELSLLVGWYLGQSLEFGIAGAVIGCGLAAKSLKPLFVKVLVSIIILLIITIALQNIT